MSGQEVTVDDLTVGEQVFLELFTGDEILCHVEQVDPETNRAIVAVRMHGNRHAPRDILEVDLAEVQVAITKTACINTADPQTGRPSDR